MQNDSLNSTKLFNNRSKYLFIIIQLRKYLITSYLNFNTQKNPESYNYAHIIDEKMLGECDPSKITQLLSGKIGNEHRPLSPKEVLFSNLQK